MLDYSAKRPGLCCSDVIFDGDIEASFGLEDFVENLAVMKIQRMRRLSSPNWSKKYSPKMTSFSIKIFWPEVRADEDPMYCQT